MRKQAQYINIKGMNQDLSISKFRPEFIHSGMNIKLTSDGDLMTVSNERGNVLVSLKDFETNEDVTLQGKAIGYAIIDKYLVLFTTTRDTFNASGTDRIYRLEQSIADNPFTYKVYMLFSGNGEDSLMFAKDSLIECVTDIEGDEVYKVYWIDNNNPIKVINILPSEDTSYSNRSFDFVPIIMPPVPEHSLGVNINRQPTGGSFHSGVVKYLITYISNLGVESNLLYDSPLYYNSFVDRAGSPEETCPNSYDIGISKEHVLREFKYVRIYAIEYTSQNIINKIRILQDIDISNIGTGTGHVYVTDIGTNGTLVSLDDLRHLNRDTLIVKAIASKDNTLFLGNISIADNSIVETLQKQYFTNPLTITTTPIREIYINRDTSFNSNMYGYMPYSLKYNSNNIKHWKYKEPYVLGFQLVHKTGHVTTPIYIGQIAYMDKSYEVEEYYENVIPNESNIATKYLGNKITFTSFYVLLTKADKDFMQDNGYVGIKPLYVEKNSRNRRAVSQGILTGTLANAKNRNLNNPFSYVDYRLRYNTEFVKSRFLTFPSSGPSTDYDGDIYRTPSGTSSARFSEPYVSVPYTSLSSSLREGSWNALFATYFPNSVGHIITPMTLEPTDRVYFTAISVPVKEIAASMPTITGPEGYAKLIDNNQIGNANYRDNDYWFIDKNIVNFWSPETELGDVRFIASNINKIQYRGISNISRSNITSEFSYTWNDDTSNMVSDINRNEWDSQFLFTTTSFARTGLKWRDVGAGNNITTLGIPWTSKTVTKVPNSFTINRKTNSFYNIGNHNHMLKKDLICNISTPSFISKEKGVNTIKLSSHYKTSTANYLSKVEEVLIANDLEGAVYGYYKGECPIYYNSNTHLAFSLSYYDESIISIGNNYISAIPEFWNPLTRTLPYGDYSSFNYPPLWFLNDVNPTKSPLKQLFLNSDNYLLRSYEDLSSTAVANDIFDPAGTKTGLPYLWIVDILQDVSIPEYSTIESILNEKWISAGPVVPFTDANNDTYITYSEGDTYIQRYDILRTYSPDLNAKERINYNSDAVSVWIESYINLDGRYDNHRYNLNTILRLPDSFNLNNPVYSQVNNFFTYNIINYNILNKNEFHHTLAWSPVKFSNSIVDKWTQISLTDSIDVTGNYGSINKLINYNNNIIGFQDKAMFNVMYNSRVQVPTSDNNPIELAQALKVPEVSYLNTYKGADNKWGVGILNSVLYYIDGYNSSFNMIGNNLQNITDVMGMKSWAKNNIKVRGERSNSNTLAHLLHLDNINNRAYLNNAYYSLGYSDYLSQFESFYSYGSADWLFTHMNDSISIDSISIDSTSVETRLWVNNKGDYNKFFGTLYPSTINYYVNPEPHTDKIFDNFQYRLDIYDISNNYKANENLSVAEFKTEFQRKSLALNGPWGHKKYRTWSYPIPRMTEKGNDNNWRTTMNRLRNPWMEMTLKFNNVNNRKFLLHDLIITYTTSK